MKLSKLAGVLILVAPLSVLAHAKLKTSTPAANSVVQSAPKEVALHFSEELEIAMSKLEVKNLTTGEIVSEGALENAGDDKASLKVGLKSLKKQKSEFEVSWKAVAKDTHKMPGHFKFTFDPKN
jgi:methionine-rich copper-binding protein CopC